MILLIIFAIGWLLWLWDKDDLERIIREKHCASTALIVKHRGIHWRIR